MLRLSTLLSAASITVTMPVLEITNDLHAGITPLLNNCQVLATNMPVDAADGTKQTVQQMVNFLMELSTYEDKIGAANYLTGKIADLTKECDAYAKQVKKNTKDHNAKIQEWDAERMAYEASITMLRNELVQSRDIAAALAQNPIVASEKPYREKIPNTEKFDGTRSKLRTLITQLRLKATIYQDEQAKLRLAINCLTGEAMDQV